MVSVSRRRHSPALTSFRAHRPSTAPSLRRGSVVHGHRRYYGPLRLPLRSPPFRGYSAYRVRRSQSTPRVGTPRVSLLGRRRVSPVPTMAVPPFHVPLRRRVLRGCISKRFTPSMAFASSVPGSAPGWSPCGQFFTTRQASLHAADWWVAPSSRRARPRASTPGSLRTLAGCYKGGLVPPLTGLSPASHRELQDAPC